MKCPGSGVLVELTNNQDDTLDVVCPVCQGIIDTGWYDSDVQEPPEVVPEHEPQRATRRCGR